MSDLILKYGTLAETTSNVKFSYSAPGIAANVLFPKSTAGASAKNQAIMIKAVAQRNIDYIGRYISFIEEGKFVAQAKTALFMVANTAEGAKESCDRWQGGFIKLYSIDDLKQMQVPYQDMFVDALLLNGWALSYEKEKENEAPLPQPALAPSTANTVAATVATAKKPKWWRFWKHR